MSIVHSLKIRASTCVTCPFVDGTSRAEMERVAGMPMPKLIREQGIVCHEDMHRNGALLQCPAARPWLDREEARHDTRTERHTRTTSR